MVITYNSGPIAWYFTKKSMVVMSKAESEYIAVVTATKRVQRVGGLDSIQTAHKPQKMMTHESKLSSPDESLDKNYIGH